MRRSFLLLTAFLCSCSKGGEPAASPSAFPSSPSAVQQPGDAQAPLDPSHVAIPHLALNEAIFSTGDYFRLIDDLRTLGRIDNDGAVSSLAQRLYDAFHASQATAALNTFLTGPLLDATVGEGEAPVRSEAAALSENLADAREKITALLEDSSRSYPFPRKLPQLERAVGETDAYMQWLTAHLEKLPINGVFMAAAEKGIQGEYAKLRPALAAITSGVAEASRASQSVAALRKGIRDLGLKVKRADATKIEQASTLAHLLDRLTTAQDALGVLVYVWEMPGGQAEIRQASTDLANFFQDKNAEDLACLAQANCGNPILGVEKLVIFGKLESYGLAKIRSQIDASVRATILGTVANALVAELPQIPLTIRDQLAARTAPLVSLLAQVEKAPADFIRSRVEPWARANLRERVRAADVEAIKVSFPQPQRVQLEVAATPGSSGAEVVGAVLAGVPPMLAPLDEPGLRADLLAGIQTMLAVRGYRGASGAEVAGFGLPLADSFRLSPALRISARSANAGAGAQAELLLGFARQAKFYRDWELNQYDVSLGKFTVNDLVPEVPEGLILSSVAPKSAFFALAVGNAADLLDAVNDSLWTRGEAAAPRALVNGSPAALLRPAHAARLLLAVDELSEAVDGMENSASPALKRAAPRVEAERAKLPALEASLAYFLAHVAASTNGAIASGVHADSGALDAPTQLEDQALAIRALLAASKRLSRADLRQAAERVYAGMNQAFFDPASQFYLAEIGAGGGRKAALPDVARVILAGEELADTLPAAEKANWNQLARPWIAAMDQL